MRTAAILALSLFFLSSGVEVEERSGVHFRADYASPFIHATDDASPNAVLLGIFQRRASRSKASSGIVPGLGTGVALLSRLESMKTDALFPRLSQRDLFQRLQVYRI